jgi:hypothetical protein
MSVNDPARQRLDASKAYINTALPGDEIGAVGFEDYGYTIAPMALMPAGATTLSNVLETNVFAGGGTNIGAGLSTACSLLDDASLPVQRAAILLTDGDGGYSDEAACFADRGWRVFTVGLGSGVNDALLQTIATTTGGVYQAVPSAQNLQCEFQKIRAEAAGASPAPCASDLIQLGQTVTKVV